MQPSHKLHKLGLTDLARGGRILKIGMSSLAEGSSTRLASSACLASREAWSCRNVECTEVSMGNALGLGQGTCSMNTATKVEPAQHAGSIWSLGRLPTDRQWLAGRITPLKVVIAFVRAQHHHETCRWLCTRLMDRAVCMQQRQPGNL